MINEFHTKRVLDMCKDHGGKVVCGGTGNIKDKFIAPTIIDEPSFESAVMKEEIFGPVLPVVSFKDIQEVVDHMHDREKSLVMYYFGSVFGENKEILERQMQSGSMCINDVLVQNLNPDLPFGGVGSSGQGRIHGKDGFLAFSNSKSILVKPTIDVDVITKLIMPPYSNFEQTQLRILLGKFPNLNFLGSTLNQSHIQKFLLLIATVFTTLFYLYFL